MAQFYLRTHSRRYEFHCGKSTNSSPSSSEGQTRAWFGFSTSVGPKIPITAADTGGGVVTGYNGSANLSDASGSLGPTAVEPFVDGVWTGPVSVTLAWVDDVLTATHPKSLTVWP